jgi:hypothetical protein
MNIKKEQERNRKILENAQSSVKDTLTQASLNLILETFEIESNFDTEVRSLVGEVFAKLPVHRSGHQYMAATVFVDAACYLVMNEAMTSMQAADSMTGLSAYEKDKIAYGVLNKLTNALREAMTLLAESNYKTTMIPKIFDEGDKKP